MKKPSKKKQTKPKASPETPAAASLTSVPVVPTEPVRYELPPPEALYAEAMQEEDQAVLRDYARVIQVLREKHFSFREIAEWMNERGFTTDRNEVYRIYSKILPPDAEAYEAQAADDEEARGM